MKTFIFLFCTVAVGFTPDIMVSQNSKIAIQVSKDFTLDEIFDLIMDQTDFKFFYEEGIFNDHPKVHIAEGVLSTSQLLEKSLALGKLKMEIISGNSIIISDNSKSAVDISQKYIVSGVITDENGQLVPGANIIEKGTTNGVQSDFDGKFTISLKSGAVLVISYIGYVTQEILVKEEEELSIKLEPDSGLLDEVVVIGYGSQRRSLITNAVSEMKITDDKLRPTLSPSQLLEGRMPGVQVGSSSGNLGASETIRIRGAASLSASNEPLYVIDGVPITNFKGSIINMGEDMSSLATLNLNDIESITVLKDAASASIYGSRGTNGVVVITTKKGKEGASRLNINLSTGFSEFANPNKVKFTDSKLYLEVLNEGINNYNQQNGFQIGDSGFIVNEQNPFEGLPDTDWLGLITQQGIYSNLDLSFSGGNKKTNFYVGGNYTNKEGVIKTNKIEKINFKVNLNHEMFPWLTIGTSSSANYMKNHRVPGANYGSTIVARAVEQRPYDRVYKPNGEYYVGGTDQLKRHNPMQILNEQDAYVDNFRFLGNLYAKINFTDNLSWKTSINGDIMYTDDYVYYNENHPYGTGVGRLVEYNRLLSNILTENVLNYEVALKDIVDVSLMAGHSFQKIRNKNSLIDSRGFPSPSFNVSSVASEIFEARGITSEFAMESYFGRAVFSFEDDKYILSSSLRTDGSSKFSKNNRWDLFPSLSLGWNLGQENFLKDSTTDLKFRMSYGETGNQEGISYYAYQSLISGGYNYGEESGIAVGSFGNENLKWEKTNQFDIGVDVGFWKGKVNFMVDYYKKNTHDLLYSTPIHTTSGTSSILRNVGTLQNEGIEFALNAHFNIGELAWNSQFNISSNKNKITKLNGEEGAIPIGSNRALVVGDELGAFYIFEMEGIYQYDGEVPQEQYDLGVRAGDVKWRDLDGNNIINDNDRVVKGSSNPDFFGGWNNSFSYGGFDLDIFTTFMYGNDVYAEWKAKGTGSMGGQYAKVEDVVNKRWTGPGTSNTQPRAVYGYSHNLKNSDMWLEDGSFFRLRTVTLSYNFKPGVLGFNKLRVYAQADNLLLFTKYSGWDPEVNTNLDPRFVGMDNYSVPQPRTISIGANISL